MNSRHLLCALAVAVLAIPASARQLTPGQVAQDIRAHGARATVRSLDQTGRLDSVLNSIASGNAAWIRLSPDLAKGTDAGNSTGLTIALARALPKNPKAVLTILDDGLVIGSNAVCSAPFIEPTARELKEYLDRAIPAVTRVAESDRYPRRSACLHALQRSAELTAAPSS